MVIQRWQSVFLLLACTLVCIFTFTPFAVTSDNSSICAKDFDVWMVVNILIAALLFLNIFLFKNIKRQMTVTLVSILLLCASIVTGGFILYGHLANASIVWFGGVMLLVAAIIFCIAAYTRMRHDLKLISSYDRLR